MCFTGRSQDLSAELMEKFRQYSVDTGVLPENIVFLPKNGAFNINDKFIFLFDKSDIKTLISYFSLLSGVPG